MPKKIDPEVQARAVRLVARMMLRGLIDNIQFSWVKLGPDICAQVLKGESTTLAAPSWRRPFSAWPAPPTARAKISMNSRPWPTSRDGPLANAALSTTLL